MGYSSSPSWSTTKSGISLYISQTVFRVQIFQILMLMGHFALMRPFSHNGPTCEFYTHKMTQFLSQLATWQVLNSRSVSPNVPITTHLPLITRYMVSYGKSCVILCCHEIRTYKRLVIIKVPTKFGRGSLRIEVLRWVLLQARGQSLGPDTRVPCKPDWDMLGPMIQSPLLKFFD